MRPTTPFLRTSLLLVFFLFLLSQSGFSQTEDRIKVTAVTPGRNTGQDYTPWLDDNLANRVLSNWSESNMEYVDVTLTLAGKTKLSRIAVYDDQGVFNENPAYLFALNGTTKTYLGTFEGQRYQEWVDLPVDAAVTADAIMVWKYGNNIPQKIKVFGSAATSTTSPAPAPVPVPVPVPTPPKTPSLGNLVTIEVLFSKAPAAASSTVTDLKYGKQAVFQFEADDNSNVAIATADYLARGSGRPTLTDGCGNTVNYRIAMAVNGRSNYDNEDFGDGVVTWKATWDQLAAFVKDGNAVENHAFYHNLTGNYDFNGDVPRNLRENLTFIYKGLKAKGVEYRMRTVVRPNNDAGYVRAADEADYLGATSQGQEAGYVKYPLYTRTVDVQTLPSGFVHLGRDFSELKTWTQINGVEENLDQLVAGSSASEHLLYRLGTHVAPLSATQSIFNHLSATAGDRVWVTHMDELLEYLEVKRQVVKSETLSDNKLTITLDYSRVPVINRYRDLSLRVSGGAIQSVTVSGADRSSYNRATGLVNVFRQNTSFKDPAYDATTTTSSGSYLRAAPADLAAPLVENQLQLNAFPNPFTSQTTVQFALPEAGPVTLDLLDVTGKVVRHLFAGAAPAGAVQRTALSRDGLTQKIYVLRLLTAHKVLTQKLVLTQ